MLGLFGWMDYLIFVKWFFPINIDSTERIPLFGGKIDDKCVSGDKWPLGKYEVDGAGNQILTSWELAK